MPINGSVNNKVSAYLYGSLTPPTRLDDRIRDHSLLVLRLIPYVYEFCRQILVTVSNNVRSGLFCWHAGYVSI